MPISFKVNTGNMTRAAASYDATHHDCNFRVYAFTGSTTSDFVNYFSGSAVTDGFVNHAADQYKWDTTSNTWIPNGTDLERKWPKYSPLTFFAVAGDLDFNADVAVGIEAISESNTNKVVKAKIKDFIADGIVSSQRDLMYALKRQARPETTTTVTSDGVSKTYGEVTLDFKHILSQICFEAENQDASSEYQIKSITLYNIVKQGTCEIYSLAGNSGDGLTVNWKLATDASLTHNYYIDNLNTNGLPKLNKTNDSWTNKTTKINISNPNCSSITINEAGNKEGREKYVARAMNMIPQSLTGSVTTNSETGAVTPSGAYIKVSFYLNEETTARDAYIALTDSWLTGKRYVYKLIFKGGDLIKYTLTFNEYDSTYDQDQKF